MDDTASHDATPNSSSTNVIPAELTALKQWVCWHFFNRGGKPTKVPISLEKINRRFPGGKTHHWRNAKADDPSTWMPYRIAADMHKRGLGTDGIGFMFAADDPYVGIDLDNCRDPETGIIDAWAQEIITRFATYAEVSPSGRGVKMIGRGTLPIETTGRKRNLGDGRAIEAYQHGRYFAITGDLLDVGASEIADCGDAIEWLWGLHFAPAEAPSAKCNHAHCDHDRAHGHDPITLSSDAELVDRIRRSRQCAKFDRLWQGDLSDYQGDHSAADMGLCAMLAFWTGGDADTIDRLFRQSGLMREKWERADYSQGTIGKAVNGCREFWTPPKVNSSSMGEETHRRTVDSAQFNIPETELTPGILRPHITPQYSPCRRNKVALQRIADPSQHRISGFACRCHSCDMCKSPWEQNRIAWFTGIVQQFPEVWLLVANDEAESTRIRNHISYLSRKTENVYYIKVPIAGCKVVWLCSHKFSEDAKLKTTDEATSALRYAIPDVPEKQRIGCTRSLAYEHSREQSTGEWTVVQDQPPLTKSTWDLICDALHAREIDYTISDSVEFERKNLDFHIPDDWNDRDVAELYRDMVDGWMPEVEWDSNLGPKAERKHFQFG